MAWCDLYNYYHSFYSVEGQFEWTDTKKVNYTNWDEGEPNDFGTGEDCTIMESKKIRTQLKDKEWTWIDFPCDLSTNGYFDNIALCEK